MLPVRTLLALSFVFITLPLTAATQVYKKVQPDGSIVYSDEPIENAEVLMVEPVPTVPAYKAPEPAVRLQGQTQDAPKALYQSLQIQEPGHDSAFHSGSGDISIQISSDPILMPGHRFKLFLDNQLISEQTQTSLKLSNVDRGTHTLSVHLVDQSGSVIKTANSTFTIHRPSILN